MPAAQAQLPGPSVAIKTDQSALSLGAANTTTVTATVTYTDTAPTAGNVAITATAPDGWKATVEPATLSLTGGQSGTVKITLVAPAAKTGAATGNLDVKATATPGTPGRAPGTASASVALTRVDPIPPPPPNYTPYYVAAGALALLAIAGAVLAKRRRDARLAAEKAAAEAAFLARETGISIHHVDGPLPFGGKREAIYRVAVQNTSERPRVAVIAIAEKPDGWRAAPSIPRIPLSPGERVVISVYVDPAPGTPWHATGDIIVSAKPEEARERDERVTIKAIAPPVRVPVVDKSEPAIGAREDIRKSKFILRR